MAAKYTGKTDKQWHANLMCKISDKLRDEELRTLKQLINMAEEVPQKELEKCNDFYIFWSLLERLGKIRVGEYDILINNLELLHRQDCVHVIEEHIIKIDEYRQGKPTLPSSGAAVGPPPLLTNPTRTPQASTRVVRAPASADIDKQDEGGETALMKAAQQGYVRLVKDLLESGADPDLSNRLGLTVLMCACEDDHKEIVAALIENGADVNLKNKHGSTALMHSCIKGQKETVAALIENGAEVNFISEHGWTALMRACSDGHTEIASVLIENGADVNFKNKMGVTALALAEIRGRNEIVKMLMAAGSKR